MNLLSIKLNSENYRLLKKFSKPIIIPESQPSKFDPICFAGLNGTGKSNLLELLADCFYISEFYIIYNKLPDYEKEPINFEIEYSLIKGKSHIYVKITRANNKVTFSKKENIHDEYVKIDRSEYLFDFFPTRIVGYSSGMNETLSIPFYEQQRNIGIDFATSTSKSANYKDFKLPSRLVYLGEQNSLLLILSNLIFSKNNKQLKKHIEVKDIKSFDIQIRRDPRKEIRTNYQLDSIIDKLIKSTPIKKREYDGISLKFLINKATKEALLDNFGSASNFYYELSLLNNLNSLSISKSLRNWINIKRRKEGQVIKTPVIADYEKFFLIENIKIENTQAKEIDYTGLSDGQFQYLQTIGAFSIFDEPNTLFLLDEPDTHFNPQWCKQLVSDISHVYKKNNQEYVIASHSPYIISSIRRDMVFKFTKAKNGKVNIERPEIETFGASIDVILKAIFGIDGDIPTYAEELIHNILKTKDYQKGFNMLQLLGTSFKKMEASQHVKKLNKA